MPFADPGSLNGKPSGIEKSEARSRAVISPLSKQDSRRNSFALLCKRYIKYFASNAVLFASLLAPASTLFDIPALTQQWFPPEDSPPASLALSAVGLAFDVLGNVLLLLNFWERFVDHWRLWNGLSSLCWLVKNILAIINCIVFSSAPSGADRPAGAAFYSAIVSCALSGAINILLLIRLAFVTEQPQRATLLQARRYLLAMSSLILFLEFEALIFNRIEHWSYSNSLYYSIVSVNTVGFGDFVPVTTAGRVLNVIFLIISIVLLGNFVSTASAYTSQTVQDRRQAYKKKNEKANLEKTNGRSITLREEMRGLRNILETEVRKFERQDVFTSLAAMAILWVAGAAVFSQTEGWTYGIAAYFVSELFLTVGYGDFVPTTPAGRVFFLLYALITVPVVTSFVLSVLTNMLHAHAIEGFRRNAKTRREPESEPQALPEDHSALIEKYGSQLDSADSDRDAFVRQFDDFGDGGSSNLAVPRSPPSEESSQQDMLLNQMVDLILLLETESRALICEGHKDTEVDILLRADWLQQRSALRHHGVNVELQQHLASSAGEENAKRYRRILAALLATSSRALQLWVHDGKDAETFQRVPPGTLAKEGQ